MNFDPSFQRYLYAKRTVDDRALNRLVWKTLEERLAACKGFPNLQVLDLGGGVGTMFQRMVEWGLLARGEYTLLDEEVENIRSAQDGISRWAKVQHLQMDEIGERLVLTGKGTEFHLETVAAEMGAYLNARMGRQWDLIVAHAFLDLVDVPAVLPHLKAALRPGGLMYLTINFDGLSAFEPIFDPELDERIIQLYHLTMDERAAAGHPSAGSRTGRRMFTWLRESGLRILEAGSSDWSVYPREGGYPADEAYFLRYILSFFSQSLNGRVELVQDDFAAWLAEREQQIERGELVFIAHQFDFLVEVV
jgi:SAM-dependent methyltransferase